ncbi:MAG: BamA/TamA family outer membrane protein [Labilithrix sp.]|nr:BamA/TamA family outer membrane protein [Labilithrix sp.]MCW5817740.1 BamA/TamA family outer membrane protein [Labilithrix sp.]
MPLLGGARRHLVVSAVALAALTGGTGCYRVPDGKRAVADVEIRGAKNVDEDDLLTRIDTREDVRFLGIFHGVVYDYEVFDPYALRRDLQRVERYLRARGYYEAHVYASRVIEKRDKVYVTIAVAEGEPVTVDSFAVVPTSPLDADSQKAMRVEILRALPRDSRFDEDKFDESEKAATRALTATGYAAAKVERKAEVDLASHRATLTYTVTPGPRVKFGAVTFEGLGTLPEDAVRRVFGVEQGKVYSSAELEDGKQALLNLGVFATVDVVADTSQIETSPEVPVTVKAQTTKIRAFLIGGGFELDSLKTDGHIQLGWQNSNFFGGLRKLDVRYKPGIIAYPTRFPNLDPPTAPLYEHRFSTTLSQPAFLEKRTTGFIRAEYNVYPVLLPAKQDGTFDKNVVGYHEPRGAIGLERHFFQRLYASPEIDLQANFPFDYLGRSDVRPLVISYVALATNLDFRDNPSKPHRGFWIGNVLQGAAGGDATDIRVQPDVRGYIPLHRKLTLALRGSLGFLFPANYMLESRASFLASGGADDRDYQILFFRGFFSGGPTQNRGYPLRGISPHDTIPYLSPAGQSSAAGSCDPAKQGCDLPTGGLTLWEASAELRINVSGPFSTALFCDASDVSPFSVNIRPDHPHLSCGAGARYDTPVGPIRFDVGYRIPGLQFPSGDRFENEPDPLLGVLPIAIAFGIGEAF